MKTCYALYFFIGLCLLLSCSNPPKGAFFYGALGLGKSRILVANSLAGALALAMYDVDGKLLGVLDDGTADSLTPRGISPINYTDFLVAYEGVDQVKKISLLGTSSEFISNVNVNGNIFQSAIDSRNGNYFLIESNTVEGFEISGTRIGNPSIGTTIGSCVLNVPRGIDIDANGYLAVVGTGNDRLNLYNITNPASPTCVTANTTFGNVDPVAIIAHSNGFYYVATQGDDRIYRFAGNLTGSGTTIYNNIAVINNPSALLEMPDGSILVASDGTNDIVRIDVSGNYIGTFARDAFSGAVTQMALMPGINE